MKLDITFDGLTLKNPLMPASGPLVGDLEKVGAVVTKTISSKAAIVPRPCIYGDRYFVMNSELWSEHSKEVWLEDILPSYRKEGIPLIISVGHGTFDTSTGFLCRCI